MPKVQSQSHSAGSSTPFQTAHVLKRNQACHQCRRRKLVSATRCLLPYNLLTNRYQQKWLASLLLFACDPCSYKPLVSEAPPVEPVETPKTRFEKLESRINELENLLREKDRALNNYIGDPQRPASNGYAPHTVNQLNVQPNGFNLDAGSSLGSGVGMTPPDVDVTALFDNFSSAKSSLVYSSWPANLPNRDVTRHLVEAYFAFHLHAHRLFHGPSFIASLDFHPSDPRFPWVAILHAMCAIGSLYVANIPPVPEPPGGYPARKLTIAILCRRMYSTVVVPDEVFEGRLRNIHRRPDSFAEQQANFAKEHAERSLDVGEHKFQIVQVTLMLTWFYWCHGRCVYSKSFLAAAQALRIAIPCGLNVCPPFHSIQDTVRPPSIIPPAKTVFEDEIRRNTFWLAYATERQMGTGNGWALSLDDQDICQLMPLRFDQLEQGVLVYPAQRQWSHDKDLLLKNKDDQVDSFILYIKATIILSRVKVFNLRFKGKHYVGDASVISPNNSPAGEPPDRFDIQEAPAFQELDHIITNFKTLFPPHLKNPLSGPTIDPYLYITHLMVHLACIILHEPHSQIGNPHCSHADKILRASRAIVNQMYETNATSYDLTLLGLHPIMVWFMAGRVLIRFLKAALDMNDEHQTVQLQAELSFVRSMIAKAGERVTLAQRYRKMFDETLRNTCGQAFVDAAINTSFVPVNGYAHSTPTYTADSSRTAGNMYVQYGAPTVVPSPPNARPVPS
ncbi:hypothetical protein K474DRAFT_1590244 [Panus rudis PR-1116 ss-1]|nr:hypothetical protein K474DRAFT_1590244 [Panus rudis PR-1116 ss-1]